MVFDGTAGFPATSIVVHTCKHVVSLVQVKSGTTSAVDSGWLKAGRPGWWFGFVQVYDGGGASAPAARPGPSTLLALDGSAEITLDDCGVSR